ncbi:hypothetical protein ACNSTQ_08655 [Alkalihalobacterium sp. APHAB7]
MNSKPPHNDHFFIFSIRRMTRFTRVNKNTPVAKNTVIASTVITPFYGGLLAVHHGIVDDIFHTFYELLFIV